MQTVTMTLICVLIITSSAIDKMFEIYTFYENRTEICIFFENRTEIYILFENRFEIYLAFCSKIGPKISKILSMVDGLNIRITGFL